MLINVINSRIPVKNINPRVLAKAASPRVPAKAASPRVPDCIWLIVCEYLTDLDKVLFLSSNKHLHKLKHQVWFDLSTKLKYIRRSPYKNRFRSAIINADKIFDLYKELNDRDNYYSGNKYIDLPNLQKLTIQINTNEKKILYGDQNFHKLNIKILIFEDNCGSDWGSHQHKISCELPSSIIKFSTNSDNILCKFKYLPKNIEELNCSVPDLDLSGIPKIKSISNMKGTLDKKIISKSLKQLSFGFYHNINHDLIDGLSCDTLEHIYNVPTLKNIILPPTIINLSFSSYFNEEILFGAIPSNVKKIKIRNWFEQKINQNVLPNGLKILHLGTYFNHEILSGTIPNTVVDLKLGNRFNQMLHRKNIPEHIQKLKLGNDFNQNLNNILPQSITHLILGANFKQSYSFITNLTNLTHLTMHVYNSNLVLSSKITYLNITSCFKNDELKYVSSSVTKLVICSNISQTITKYIPMHITSVTLSKYNDKLMLNLPSTVKCLKIKQGTFDTYVPLFIIELKIKYYRFDIIFLSKNIKKLKIMPDCKIDKEIRQNIRVSYYKNKN